MAITKSDYTALAELCEEALSQHGPDRRERLQEALYLAEEMHAETGYADPVEEWIHRVENTLTVEFGEAWMLEE